MSYSIRSALSLMILLALAPAAANEDALVPVGLGKQLLVDDQVV